MTHDRWQEIKKLIASQYTISDSYTEALDPGQAECLEFQSAQGLLRACFVTQPKVLDKKTLYSHRAGGETTTDYKYSDTEVASHLEVWLWVESLQDWQELQADQLLKG